MMTLYKREAKVTFIFNRPMMSGQRTDTIHWLSRAMRAVDGGEAIVLVDDDTRMEPLDAAGLDALDFRIGWSDEERRAFTGEPDQNTEETEA